MNEEIIEMLSDHEMQAKDIAAEMNIERRHVEASLHDLRDRGRVINLANGCWRLIKRVVRRDEQK